MSVHFYLCIINFVPLCALPNCSYFVRACLPLIERLLAFEPRLVTLNVSHASLAGIATGCANVVMRRVVFKVYWRLCCKSFLVSSLHLFVLPCNPLFFHHYCVMQCSMHTITRMHPLPSAPSFVCWTVFYPAWTSMCFPIPSPHTAVGLR